MPSCDVPVEVFDLFQRNDDQCDALLLKMFSGEIVRWAKLVLKKYGRESHAHEAWHNDMSSVGALKLWICLRGDPQTPGVHKLERSRIECGEHLIRRLYFEAINAMHKELGEFLYVVPLKHLTVPPGDDHEQGLKLRVFSIQAKPEPHEDLPLYIDYRNTAEYFETIDKLVELLHNQLEDGDLTLVNEVIRMAKRGGQRVNISEIGRNLKLAESTVRDRLKALGQRVLRAADDELREDTTRWWRKSLRNAA